MNRDLGGRRPPPLVLVADIGGTHVRFGLADPEGPVHRETTLYCADFADPAAAAEEYLTGLEAASRPTRGVFAVASPIMGDRVEITNQRWDFSIEDTRRRLGLAELRAINDFTALALSLPVLQQEDVRQVKPGQRRLGAPIALLGPGTGLGVSGLVPCGDRWVPLSAEGGHRDLAATNEREWQIVRHLLRDYDHVSAERVLSGPGLVMLYRALCELEGRAPEDLAPADVEHRARQRADGLEAEAVGLFSGWLGAVAGDLALTLGAVGGLYLAGGILPKMGPVFDADRFCERFVAKGRFRDYLEAIPVALVLHRTAALIGAVRALDLS